MSIEKRITLYCLKISENDKGFNNETLFNQEVLRSYLMNNFSQKSEIYFALHDKDINEETNSLKTPHIHVCIKLIYNGGKTFSTMKKLFPNSHIEECMNWENAVLYLTHETPKAIEEGKYRYSRDIVYNIFNSDIEKYYSSPVYMPFDWDKIEEYILIDRMLNITQYGRRFGYSNIQSKWKTIKEIINDLLAEEEDKRLLEEKQKYMNELKENKGFIEEVNSKLEDF